MEPELNINDLWKVWQWDEKVKFVSHLCRRIDYRLNGKTLYERVIPMGAQPIF